MHRYVYMYMCSVCVCVFCIRFPFSVLWLASLRGAVRADNVFLQNPPGWLPRAACFGAVFFARASFLRVFASVDCTCVARCRVFGGFLIGPQVPSSTLDFRMLRLETLDMSLFDKYLHVFAISRWIECIGCFSKYVEIWAVPQDLTDTEMLISVCLQRSSMFLFLGCGRPCFLSELREADERKQR